MGQDKGAACDKERVNLRQQGSAVPYNWFLPVISGFERSSLLMTDKHQSDMYLENRILKIKDNS